MKIGLVRHLKVKKEKPTQFMTEGELFQWVQEYDGAEIEDYREHIEEVEWVQCYSSDMKRAVKTASYLFQGEVKQIKELREIPIYPFHLRNVKMPFVLWMFLFRFAWLMNHKTQKEAKAAVKCRVRKVIDQIESENEGETLIVSHGALMIYLNKELIKRGFIGPKLTRAKNGVLYLYEK
ncbi:histidine phosphatase family protein [Metabacillus niabensis]|uniref:Broad specificity phosphatase PhoE n=1 Tax=Metabacillus niabensis TaxID=324854 RepID=A0ABT9ZA72_9BACI|nr:histidine phosphatase family protein [Metabacillus niabensis]MDQ0228528.1 broad specificity phosphatase PhoE [Metabacillus niabensis]